MYSKRLADGVAAVATGEVNCFFSQGNYVALSRCKRKQLCAARGVAADADAVHAKNVTKM